MSDNIILNISKIICKENCENLSFQDISFASKKIEEILKKEKIRKQLIENELTTIKPEKLVINYELNKNLNKIESNILHLEVYLDVLESKKRILSIETEKKKFFSETQQLAM